MTRNEALEILDHNWTRLVNPDYTDEELGKAQNMAIRSLEARESLYEKTAEWEAEALYEVEKHIHDEDVGEWRKWSHILTERTAFSCDVKKHLKEVEDDK